MLHRSKESRLKVDSVLRPFLKSIKQHGESHVYQSLTPEVKHNLCCARIVQGNFSEWDGWQYRDDWAAGMRYGTSNIPFWNGDPVDRLIIIGEQGIGDEVLFASVIPEAMIRCKQVTYACDERLVMPLARSYRGLHTKIRKVDVRDDLLEGFDAYIPAADLLPVFRRRQGDFPKKPFIKPSSDRLAEFEKYRGRIGISWRGRHGKINPLDLGLENPLSLQYDETHPEIETPDIDLRNDIEGVLALSSVLAKIVVVPTSVWHFAAAVGTKTEVIVAPRGSEDDGAYDEIDYHTALGVSPWYGKSTVYRDVLDWRRNAL